jgi:hypothetical protein
VHLLGRPCRLLQGCTTNRWHVVRLLDVLSTENIFLNMENCERFCKHIRYLGAVVGSCKLYNMLLPNEGQDQLRMLGLTGYYRRFISDYAELALPLMELLIDVKKAWTSKHTDSVNTLKHTICSYPILRQYNHTKPIVVVSDASDYAIGGTLIRCYKDDPGAVAYVSRWLSTTKKNYTSKKRNAWRSSIAWPSSNAMYWRPT